MFADIFGDVAPVPQECLDAKEVCFIVPADVALIFNWNANDVTTNGGTIRLKPDHCKKVDEFAGLCKHFQKVVFTYTNDHKLWGLPCAFRDEVNKVVARLTAQGVYCVNVNSHFQKCRDANVTERDNFHFKQNPKTCAHHCRFISQWVKYCCNAMGPYAYMGSGRRARLPQSSFNRGNCDGTRLLPGGRHKGTR